MPTLTWVGKDKVVNHHHDVPFKVLQQQSRLITGVKVNLNQLR